MNIDWQDIPQNNTLFTKRNATMRDLETGKIIQYYSANTKICVIQKANYKGMTYYRTRSAKENNLDWAFEAAVFGLPNEAAPPAPTPSYSLNSHKPVTRTPKPAKVKQKVNPTPKPKSSEGGEKAEAEKPKVSFLQRLFRRRKA